MREVDILDLVENWREWNPFSSENIISTTQVLNQALLFELTLFQSPPTRGSGFSYRFSDLFNPLSVRNRFIVWYSF